MSKYGDLMLDIETMGNKSNSAIVSIGAVEFNMATGETGSEEFSVNVDLQSCIDAGLILTGDTVMWWMQQNEEARKELCKGDAISLEDALSNLSAWIGDKQYDVWGNSARFDCGIMTDAYGKFGMKIPWDFRRERDVRTLVALNPSVKEKMGKTGIAHVAVDDCKYQIAYCSATWNSLFRGHTREKSEISWEIIKKLRGKNILDRDKTKWLICFNDDRDDIDLVDLITDLITEIPK